MGIKIEHTTDGIKNVCDECGEEPQRFAIHRCNPFRDIKLTPLTGSNKNG